jgi:hypothetical protein
MLAALASGWVLVMGDIQPSLVRQCTVTEILQLALRMLFGFCTGPMLNYARLMLG